MDFPTSGRGKNFSTRPPGLGEVVLGWKERRKKVREKLGKQNNFGFFVE